MELHNEGLRLYDLGLKQRSATSRRKMRVMDFSLTPEQEQLRSLARRLLGDHAAI
jgi:hypothetical protein